MLDGAFAPLVALALPGVLVVVASLALFQFQALFRCQSIGLPRPTRDE